MQDYGMVQGRGAGVGARCDLQVGQLLTSTSASLSQVATVGQESRGEQKFWLS